MLNSIGTLVIPWQPIFLERYRARALRKHIPPANVCVMFEKKGGDLDHSQNLMDSKLNQNPASLFCHEDPTRNTYEILLTIKPTS